MVKIYFEKYRKIGEKSMFSAHICFLTYPHN